MPEPTEIETLDAARILDQDENEWTAGYLVAYRRLKTLKFFADQDIKEATSTFTSESFLVSPYSKFRLYIYLLITGSPIDIVFDVQFSYNGSTWYKYMDGPFGDLRYEDGAGDKKECLDGEIRSSYMRVKATATGTNSVNYFTASIRAEVASI